jgi:hypothetical protein
VEKNDAGKSVQSSKLLEDIDTSCPCKQCRYNYNIDSPVSVMCPFLLTKEKMCHGREAWERLGTWARHVLETMNCFKAACEKTKTSNKD